MKETGCFKKGFPVTLSVNFPDIRIYLGIRKLAGHR
jgi:hypothetical protein